MKKTIMEFYGGVKSLVVGLKITIGQFFKPSVTVHYPHQTLPIPPRFRGHIELVRDPETGRAVCFACKLCERACPSDCISVDGAKLDGAKKKSVTKYILDFTKCSLCGSCVEACRDGAIRFSREYNVVGLNKEEFIMDLFQKLEEEARNNPEPAAATESLPAKPGEIPAPAGPAPARQAVTLSPESTPPSRQVKPVAEPEKVEAK